jgi:hypothetical protein
VVVIQNLRVYAPHSALVAERMVSAALVRLVVQDVSPSLDFARSLRLHKFARADMDSTMNCSVVLRYLHTKS